MAPRRKEKLCLTSTTSADTAPQRYFFRIYDLVGYIRGFKWLLGVILGDKGVISGFSSLGGGGGGGRGQS